MTTEDLTANEQRCSQALEHIEEAIGLLRHCSLPLRFKQPDSLLEELLTALTKPTLEEILYDLGLNPHNIVYSKNLGKLIVHLDKVCG